MVFARRRVTPGFPVCLDGQPQYRAPLLGHIDFGDCSYRLGACRNLCSKELDRPDRNSRNLDHWFGLWFAPLPVSSDRRAKVILPVN